MGERREAEGGLLLFTADFPFGTGEPFLENEIGYLGDGFETVTVVPRRAEGAPRPVPRNVRVDTSLAEEHAARRTVGTVGRAIRWPGFPVEALRHLPVLFRPGGLRRLMEQVGETLRVEDWLRRRTARLVADGTVCYAYWLHTEAAALARLRGRLPGLRLVARAHGFDIYHERATPPFIPLQRTTLRGLDCVYAVSEHGKRYLEARHPGAEARLEVSRLGVPDPGFTAEPSGDGVLRVLSCSAIKGVKRLDRLVVGLARLAAGAPERRVEWHHLGDGPLRRELEDLARRSLPDTVAPMLHGQVPHAAVLNHYSREPVDVFVNTSESEGVPVSIMEALSCGIPVVAPDVGGVGEIVGSPHGRLVSGAVAPEELAAAIGSVVAARDTARQAARAAWEERWRAETNYTGFLRQLGECRPGS